MIYLYELECHIGYAIENGDLVHGVSGLTDLIWTSHSMRVSGLVVSKHDFKSDWFINCGDYPTCLL